MDPLNPNQNPIAAGSQMPPPETPRSGVGPIAGAIIVIILLVAGGLYFWGAKLNQQMNNTLPYIPADDSVPANDSQSGTLQSDTSAGLPPQSSSDDVNSIQTDFNAMDMNQMNTQNSAELNNI